MAVAPVLSAHGSSFLSLILNKYNIQSKTSLSEDFFYLSSLDLYKVIITCMIRKAKKR
ncbi:hypothetical protein HMPREF0083_05004 [Aneurinibacillus aneurinilyticus ATCC 12856]|uniref:Uncharacterized protein n=1 Tax=Aneurinibacillus aneurinilyticus ATCC 12856 TaxID=649747 RepID=U1Y3Y7_ANEAE|nr:hypothetical protein HMPREF0083_05004 [Aneurinibacillus aneurinilyticus ATCC 12856]